MLDTKELQQSASYASMASDRTDYDACYAYHDEWMLPTLHCHDFYELYIHFGGAKFYCIDNNVYPIEPFQLLVVPPFCMHGLMGDSVPRQYERAFLYITPATLRHCGSGVIDLEGFFNQYMKNGHHHFLLCEEDALTCKELIQDLQKNLRTPSPLGQFTNHTRLMQFLQIISTTMQTAQETVEPVVLNSAMHEILSYVNDHFTQPLKLETLARQFGVSTSFLSHEFVKYTGRSVYDYILYRRVLLAKAMMSTNQSLSEVAYLCGFNDYSSFLRIFRKMAGVSPSEYRKANHIGGAHA